MLVPIVVLASGCLPSATPDLPASFANRLEERGWAFEVAPQPTADLLTAADLVAQLAAVAPDVTPMLRTRAVPVFGMLGCTGAVVPCTPGGFGIPGGKPKPFWVVLYPDHTGADGDVGWVLVDARSRLNTFDVHDPLDPELQ